MTTKKVHGNRKPRVDGLTMREWDYVGCLLLGMNNKEIGVALGVSYRTVKMALVMVNRAWGTQGREEIILKAAKLRRDNETEEKSRDSGLCSGVDLGDDGDQNGV